MSVEMRNPEIPDVDLAETSIGSDPLWYDPLAKTAYSSNPGFTKGASEGWPVVSAENSMFTVVEPEAGFVEGAALAEALEAAYLHAPVSAKERSARKPLETPVEPALALDGLRWLIPQLGKGSDLRRAATRARSRLSEQEEIKSRQQQTAQYYANARDRINAEQAAEKARLESLETAGKAELGQAIGKMNSFAPKGLAEHLRVGNIIELCDELAIREEAGALATKESPDFRSKLAGRVAEYMRDPQELVNDVFVVMLLDEASEENYDTREENPMYAYLHKILTSISAIADESHYDVEDFSPEIVAKWAEIPSTLPAEMTMSEFYKVCDDNNDMMSLALRWVMHQGGAILTNSLREIAGQHPDKFVDTLHMFAEKSLDPEHDILNHVTLTSIEASLDEEEEPLAKIILSIATGVTGDNLLRQKALDLQTTLICLGIPSEKLGIRKPGTDPMANSSQIAIGPRVKRALRKLPTSVMVNQSTDYDPVLFQHKANMLHEQFLAEFEDFVLTPRGERETLLGKFLAKARREGKLSTFGFKIATETRPQPDALPGFVVNRLFELPETPELGL